MLNRYTYCPGDGTQLDIFYGSTGESSLIVINTKGRRGSGISYSWGADRFLTPWDIAKKTPKDVDYKEYYIDALIAFLTFIGHTYMGSLLTANPTRREDSPFDDRGFYNGQPPTFLACNGEELPKHADGQYIFEHLTA